VRPVTREVTVWFGGGVVVEETTETKVAPGHAVAPVE